MLIKLHCAVIVSQRLKAGRTATMLISMNREVRTMQ